MLNLKNLLVKFGITQGDMAAHCGLSRAAFSAILNHNQWGKKTNIQTLQALALGMLVAKGATAKEAETAFNPVTDGRKTANNSTETKENTMLMNKQNLHPATRRHFALVRDPFNNDVENPSDVFQNADTRFVREAMFQTALKGGFIAVVGESGAGKTTLRRELIDRINRESLPIIVIEPYVLGSEENDTKGKCMKASQVAVAIMNTIAPLEAVKIDSEARFRQVHRVLRESHKANKKHVLIIEEAHSLSVQILKHLKRFIELEEGFSKLLSVILIGQPELAVRLSANNYEVREVVQRCEMIYLQPIDASLADYLQFKFARVGVNNLQKIMDVDAVEALRDKLTIEKSKSQKAARSLLYPLAIANVLSAAMNLAVEIGAPFVTADMIRGV
jgi:type II secretory pathway predicted ATPase ExeA